MKPVRHCDADDVLMLLFLSANVIFFLRVIFRASYLTTMIFSMFSADKLFRQISVSWKIVGRISVVLIGLH